MYEYAATLLKVVDGDTVHLMVDLGFDVQRKDSFRLYGINAPEMGTDEGVQARDHLRLLLAYNLGAPNPLRITTIKDRREKYGRYLATLWMGDLNVNQQMVADGHAVEYMP